MTWKVFSLEHIQEIKHWHECNVNLLRAEKKSLLTLLPATYTQIFMKQYTLASSSYHMQHNSNHITGAGVERSATFITLDRISIDDELWTIYFFFVSCFALFFFNIVHTGLSMYYWWFFVLIYVLDTWGKLKSILIRIWDLEGFCKKSLWTQKNFSRFAKFRS